MNYLITKSFFLCFLYVDRLTLKFVLNTIFGMFLIAGFSIPVDTNSKYKTLEYWDERYKEEETYEWFGGYPNFRNVTKNFMKPSDEILVLGCGNSLMSEDIYNDGYVNVTNMDYSSIVIESMRERCKSLDRMKWLTMDINDLKFEDESFDCIIEKGTLDSLLVDEKDPWKLSDENATRMDNIMRKVSDLLRDDGVFISITFAQPHFRKPMYARDEYKWSIELHTIGETFHYFIYIMRKGGKLIAEDRKTFTKDFVSKSTMNFDFLLNFDLNEDYLLKIEL